MKLKDTYFLEEKLCQPRQHVKKQRHYFANNSLSIQGFGFSSSYVWMWELDCKESWALKSWCFWTVVMEKTLERPFDCKEIQPVQLKEISSGCLLEGLMLKLKLQYFGHLIRGTDSFGKTLIWERLKAGGEGEDRGWDGWMASPMQWIWVWVNSRSLWWTRKAGMLQSMGSQRVRHDWTTELSWT